ncbi:MAG: ARMT1-like domain-containing protein [Desulfobulbaceae bacterium]
MTKKPLFHTGTDPDRDAWLTNFFTENHLAFEAFPDVVASPEQLNFIVHMEGEPYYYPCSDELFTAIMEKRADLMLNSAYIQIWVRIEGLVRSVIDDQYRQQYLMNLLTIKYAHETASRVLLPSRLEKRLLRVFTNFSEIERPLGQEREMQNLRAFRFLQSPLFHETINSHVGLKIEKGTTLDEISLQIHLLRLQRMLLLATMDSIWKDDRLPDSDEVRRTVAGTISAEGWEWFGNWLRWVITGRNVPYILWIGGRSGEIIFDLAIIDILLSMGVKVILAVKQAFFYDSISFADLLEDPILEELLAGADINPDLNISKKALLGKLRSDLKLLVISDGTLEQFNPLLTSVTFARAFKEADLIINRCPGSAEFMNNHFLLTRDLLSITRQGAGSVQMVLRRRHPRTVRFLEQDLRSKAETLIFMVNVERQRGHKIMFYSAIVGSIPGQLERAKKILNVFVDHLRSTMENVVIINPGEHFEEGMDADDLMYMWEIFQRSGVIDIWRFQTVQDIEKSFSLMRMKVPPEWTGKDATYSTGCTKEMEIAMDMQKRYPEMQIIGPPWERFLRRKEYGVGKLYDRVLS